MNRLVECVPNFSEGRKAETVDRLVAAIESVAGVVVLDTHIDRDHNRSVITFVAEAECVVEAAVRAVALASELIDLREHTGAHPRLGATDVLPFVPVRGVTMEDCVRLAHAAGERIARELKIPVYFYERAARRPDRANLEDVRRRGYEELLYEIEFDGTRAPDVGEAVLHESAGACAVGARPLLIAYNINLQTDDILIARNIARTVRGRDGGLRYLKALGFELPTRGMVQVSMNLVNYEKTQLHHAFAAVKREAERYGVQIAGSEIVGLIPQAALEGAAEYFLQIENFAPRLVLENRIEEAFAGKEKENTMGALVIGDARKPRLGGGTAAADAASLAAALGEMIAHLTVGREKYKDVAREVQDALDELTSSRSQLSEIAQFDAWSFEQVLKARRAPQRNPDEAATRAANLEAALKTATTVPLDVAAVSVQVLELLETLAKIGNTNALSDAATGAQLALASVASARYNVLVNAAAIVDEDFVREHRLRAEELLAQAREIAARVEILFLDSIN